MSGPIYPWELAPEKNRPRRIAKKLRKRWGWLRCPNDARTRALMKEAHEAPGLINELVITTGMRNYLPTRKGGVRPAALWESCLIYDSPHKVIASTTVAGLKISTCFLVIDHEFGFGAESGEKPKPVLWETMIFGPHGAMGEDELREHGVRGEAVLNALGGYQWRYTSRKDALAHHRKLVGVAHMALQ